MTVISERFARELSGEKEMRDAYLAAQTRTRLALQIRTLRNQRNWSQETFGKVLDKPQSTVCRLEDRQYGKFTLQTLFELAAAFDVGVIVEFVPYAEFLGRMEDLSPYVLGAEPFTPDSLRPLWQKAAPSNSFPGSTSLATNSPAERRASSGPARSSASSAFREFGQARKSATQQHRKIVLGGPFADAL
jgi:transcriptional regulator with XRE-family HTH domain